MKLSWGNGEWELFKQMLLGSERAGTENVIYLFIYLKGMERL